MWILVMASRTFLKKVVDLLDVSSYLGLVLNGDASERRLFQRFPRTTKALPVCHHSEGFPFSTMPLVIPKETFSEPWCFLADAP